MRPPTDRIIHPTEHAPSATVHPVMSSGFALEAALPALRVQGYGNDRVALVMRGKTVQVYRPLHGQDGMFPMRLGRGYRINANMDVLRNGKRQAVLDFRHDLKDDRYWGGRKYANALRYYEGRGGLTARIEWAARETPTSLLALVGWHSIAGSYNKVHSQVLQITTTPALSARVLLNLEPDITDDWGNLTPVFLYRGQRLLYTHGKLQWLVRRRGSRRHASRVARREYRGRHASSPVYRADRIREPPGSGADAPVHVLCARESGGPEP